MTRFEHAVVTGGSSGIGLAIVRRLAERGTRVSVIGLDDEYMEALRNERLPRVTTAVADVGDRPALEAAVEAFTTMHGPIDLLVTCAGVVLPGYFHELPDDEFERDMKVNYLGTVHTIRAVVPGMMERRQGSIACISSTAGLIGVFGYTAYGPSKYAAVSYTHLRAHET